MSKKILLVDDSEFARRDLRLAFEAHGFQVSEAENGAECCEMLAKAEFDAIFLDYNMPVMNGLEALQRATSEGTRRQALVFMMTTETNAELKALGKELGLNGWIVKPVVIEPIVAFTVKKLSSGAA